MDRSPSPVHLSRSPRRCIDGEAVCRDWRSSRGAQCLQKREDTGDIVNPGYVGTQRRLNDHHRQIQFTRGDELRSRGTAAGILRDDDVDPLASHQFALGFELEGTAIEQNFVIGQFRKVTWVIYGADEIVVLRGAGEVIEPETTGGQQDAPWCVAQCHRGFVEICDVDPTVSRLTKPGRANVGDDRNGGLSGGRGGVVADPSGKRMGGIHEGVDAMVTQPGRQAGDPAEATDARRDGLSRGIGGATGERKRRIDVRTIGERASEPARFRRATENKNSHRAPREISS